MKSIGTQDAVRFEAVAEEETVAGTNRAGTGGGLRYITEEATPNMVNQELSHSFQAACARQLLKDEGVNASEAEVHGKIGYVEAWGTTAEDTARALDELHPRLGYAGGAIDSEERKRAGSQF